MKRGTIRAKKSEMIALWIPLPLAAALDRGVKVEDSDRSKFIRNALRERLMRKGIELVQEVA